MKTGDHYPIISLFNPGAALTGEGNLPATVDTLGPTEGVSDGAGSGYEPPKYAECRCSPTYTADASGPEGRDLKEDPKCTNEESAKPNFESVE